MKQVVAIALLVVGASGIVHGQGSPPRILSAPVSTDQSCTDQWKALRETLSENDRYSEAKANDFGRKCLGVTGPKRIDWVSAKADIDALVTESSPLVFIEPVDVGDFCPGYKSASAPQRAEFWRTFAKAVIRQEAGRDANATMWEQPVDDDGIPKPGTGEYSVGLLQLSIANRGKYKCDVPTEASLLDQSINLKCGVKIIERLVARNGIGGSVERGKVGLANYWSVVREVSLKPAASGGRETRALIIKATKSLPQCA